MIFSTPVFFLFFAIYFGLHFLVPRDYRLGVPDKANPIFWTF